MRKLTTPNRIEIQLLSHSNAQESLLGLANQNGFVRGFDIE